MTATRRRLLATGLEVTVPLLVLVAWGLASAGSETYYFPPLTDILSTFADTWLFERVGSDVVPSLLRMGAGFGIAVVVAIATGLLLGLSPRSRRAAAPIVEFLRAIPPPALLLFAILVIGVGDSMKVFIMTSNLRSADSMREFAHWFLRSTRPCGRRPASTASAGATASGA